MTHFAVFTDEQLDGIHGTLAIAKREANDLRKMGCTAFVMESDDERDFDAGDDVLRDGGSIGKARKAVLAAQAARREREALELAAATEAAAAGDAAPTETITCDNEATRVGWKEMYAINGAYTLHVSTAPDADLDGEFKAFCHDRQEMIRIQGWAFEFEAIDA